MPFAVETGDRKVELMKKEQMLYNKMQMGKGTGKRMKFGKLKDQIGRASCRERV